MSDRKSNLDTVQEYLNAFKLKHHRMLQNLDLLYDDYIRKLRDQQKEIRKKLELSFYTQLNCVQRHLQCAALPPIGELEQCGGAGHQVSELQLESSPVYNTNNERKQDNQTAITKDGSCSSTHCELETERSGSCGAITNETTSIRAPSMSLPATTNTNSSVAVTTTDSMAMARRLQHREHGRSEQSRASVGDSSSQSKQTGHAHYTHYTAAPALMEIDYEKQENLQSLLNILNDSSGSAQPTSHDQMQHKRHSNTVNKVSLVRPSMSSASSSVNASFSCLPPLPALPALVQFPPSLAPHTLPPLPPELQINNITSPSVNVPQNVNGNVSRDRNLNAHQNQNALLQHPTGIHMLLQALQHLSAHNTSNQDGNLSGIALSNVLSNSNASTNANGNSSETDFQFINIAKSSNQSQYACNLSLNATQPHNSNNQQCSQSSTIVKQEESETQQSTAMCVLGDITNRRQATWKNDRIGVVHRIKEESEGNIAGKSRKYHKQQLPAMMRSGQDNDEKDEEEEDENESYQEDDDEDDDEEIEEATQNEDEEEEEEEKGNISSIQLQLEDIPLINRIDIESSTPVLIYKTSDSSKWKCECCRKWIAYHSDYDVVIHLSQHAKERTFKCPYCCKVFKRKADVNRHSRTHTGEKPYKCSQCGKGFGTKYCLKTHVRTHTGEMPYKCSFCGKSFRQNSHLTVHWRTHTGDKPYECKICNKRFSQHSTLAVHHRIHQGEKPFVCPCCERGFTQRHSLQRHIRNMHRAYFEQHGCENISNLNTVKKNKLKESQNERARRDKELGHL